MAKDTVKRKQFVYRGFGFPVLLLNVPMVRVRGVWTPDVNYEHLQRRLLRAVAEKPARLTGDEVRFIRLSHDMTLKDFAARFAVTHPAVLKWEGAKSRLTGMSWAAEKDIRLFVLSKLRLEPRRFVTFYESLQQEPTRKPERLRIDASVA